MVEEDGRPGASGLDRSDEAGQEDRLLVERAVEPPPHLLQDLDEAPRGLSRAGHAAREGAVEVGVGVDEAGEDERALEVQHLLAGGGREGRAAPDDRVPFDPQVGPLDISRIQRRNDPVPQDHLVRPSGRSRRCASSASWHTAQAVSASGRWQLPQWVRSEERRAGKEGRCRWSPYH